LQLAQCNKIIAAAEEKKGRVREKSKQAGRWAAEKYKPIPMF
jgi:hypothetical protein